MAIVEHPHSSKNSRETQWPELSRRIAKTAKRRNLAVLWPEFSNENSTDLAGVLCWGLDAAGLKSDSVELAALIAAGGMDARQRARKFADISLPDQIENFLDRLAAGPLGLAVLSEAVVWAYALPNLAIDYAIPAVPLSAAEKGKKSKASQNTENDLPIASNSGSGIDENLWWTLLGELQTISHSAITQLSGDSPERLLAAGEIGAVLAWQLSDLPSCDSIRQESLDAIGRWFEGEGDAVAAALLDHGKKIRPVLASALRSRRLAARMKRRIQLKNAGAAIDLATWAAASCRGDGSQTLGPLGAGKEDLRPGSLMSMAATELGGPSLQTAVDATMGKTKSEGRLAWQVQLPEPAWFDEEAGLAVMLPEWDVRRGRLTLSYKNADRKVHFEISGGKHLMTSGVWGIRIWKGDRELKPTSEWQDLCWHSDDDVHYLELEQVFEDNIKVQRQMLMIRDDRCLLLADAVIGDPEDDLKVATELPLAGNVHIEEERETRELLLVDGKVRALLMPLAMSEWKVGPTAGRLKIADQNDSSESSTNLTVVAELKGKGAVYSPLWLDFDRKRLRANKTWRQLTVGEKLKLVGPNEAAAFRVQAGDDQWVLYRSLNGQHNRTFLGKNLISEFFCGRFEAEDGTIEELVSVDEQND